MGVEEVFIYHSGQREFVTIRSYGCFTFCFWLALDSIFYPEMSHVDFH